MKKVVITQATAKDFFIRGKALAKRLDRHERIKAKDMAATITCEEMAICYTRYRRRAWS